MSETENNSKSTEKEDSKRVAKLIQEILEANGYALQPYLVYSEYGVGPSVRLVSTKDESNETGDTAEAGENKKQDESPQS